MDKVYGGEITKPHARFEFAEPPQWALAAAEEIYMLYRDSNYFRSMPKEPLIKGWAIIITRNALGALV